MQVCGRLGRVMGSYSRGLLSSVVQIEEMLVVEGLAG